MSVCCCSLAGTAACQHCKNNPLATDVWTNTVTTDRTDAKPFGNGVDVCPVCGKPSTIGKPKTNADRIRSMTDEELAHLLNDCVCPIDQCPHYYDDRGCTKSECEKCWLDWLRQEATNDP